MDIGGEWESWSRHVLSELRRLDRTAEAINRRLEVLHTDIITLKAKSSLWGGVAGAIFGALASAFASVMLHR